MLKLVTTLPIAPLVSRRYNLLSFRTVNSKIFLKKEVLACQNNAVNWDWPLKPGSTDHNSWPLHTEMPCIYIAPLFQKAPSSFMSSALRKLQARPAKQPGGEGRSSFAADKGVSSKSLSRVRPELPDLFHFHSGQIHASVYFTSDAKGLHLGYCRIDFPAILCLCLLL